MLRGNLGPLFSRIDLPDMSAGMQPGLGGAVDVVVRAFPFRSVKQLSCTGALELSAIGFSQSSILSDGQLYRAWKSFGLGLLGGLAWGPFEIPVIATKADFGFELGANLHAANYTGTSLVSAYPSFLARLSLDLRTKSRLGWGIFLPLEFANKGGASILVYGLGLSGSWRLR